MSELPLVSVLIPAYNVARFAREAIASITEQTYAHLEIIVVDDGSTDGTWEVLCEVARSDSRIVLMKQEVNSGIVACLNRAWAAARGAFIARMDADDVAHPQRIERQMQCLRDRPDVALVGVSTISIDENGAEFARSAFLSSQRIIDKCLTLTSLVSHNWVARREVYEALDGYRGVAPVEDYDFLLRMRHAGYRFTNLPFFGMRIRHRAGNTYVTTGVEQIRAFEYVTKLHKERVRTGVDSFSPEAFRRSIAACSAVKALHRVSVQWLRRAFAARAKRHWIRMVAWASAGVIASPMQLRIVLRRRLMHYHVMRAGAESGVLERSV